MKSETTGEKMKVLDLFSGIGGFSLGLEAAGMQTVAFCEREPFCQAVLKKHWPDVPCHNDITTLDGGYYAGRVDVVCGGYPCQPFSVAGKRLGHADERHLWPEMLRIIQGSKPRWVIAENVAGHIKLGFDEVASSLENEGFTVWPFVIPACAVDAPHKRDRLWIFGYSQHNGSSAAYKPRSTREANDDLSQGAHEAGEPARSTGVRQGMVANTEGKQGGRLQQSRISSDAPSSSDASDFGDFVCEGGVCAKVQRERTFSREPSGGFTQWADGWPVSSPRICGVDDGIPARTHRLKALGNAVVPQIPYIIGQAIIEYERKLA